MGWYSLYLGTVRYNMRRFTDGMFTDEFGFKSHKKDLSKMAQAITFITALIEAFFNNKRADQE